MLQAFRHLHSKVHGGLPQSSDTAVNELGIRVLNCGPADVARNNAAFLAELKRGYQVLGGKPRRGSQRSKKNGIADRNRARRNRKTRTRVLSDDGSDGSEELEGLEEPEGPGETDESEDADEQPVTQPIQPRSMPFRGDNTFEIGKLYLGLRPKYANSHVCLRTTSKWSAVMVLPLVGSFETVGLRGSIYNTPLTNFRTPVCFERCKTTKIILGWAKGYEDGGLTVTKRKVPVLHFDDDDNQRGLQEGQLVDTSQRFLAWQSLDSFRPFSKFDPEGKLACGYHAALEFSKKLEARIAAKLVRRDLASGALPKHK